MSNTVYVKVRDLPAFVQRALESVKYARPDIPVEPRESVSLAVGGGDGVRGFAVLVNLHTHEYNVKWGSWGGANMFNPQNPVDLDMNAYPLPAHGAAISGSYGSHGSYATLYVHPSQATGFLPAPVSLSKQEQDCLYCFKALKGGEYRRDEMRRRNVTSATVDAMVSRGYLKRNKAGACQITTEGKNALGDYRGH